MKLIRAVAGRLTLRDTASFGKSNWLQRHRTFHAKFPKNYAISFAAFPCRRTLSCDFKGVEIQSFVLQPDEKGQTKILRPLYDARLPTQKQNNGGPPSIAYRYWKGHILGAKDLGKSHAEIGAQLNILGNMVTNFLQWFEKHELEDNLPHLRHPRNTLEWFIWYLILTTLVYTHWFIPVLQMVLYITLQIAKVLYLQFSTVFINTIYENRVLLNRDYWLKTMQKSILNR